MDYKVFATDSFANDYERAVLYLVEELGSKEAANNLMAKVSNAVSILKANPEIKAISHQPILSKRSLRVYFVGNYAMLYKFEKSTVYLVRFFHQSQLYGAASYWDSDIE